MTLPKAWLKLALITLVLLQSYAAVADAHQFHQSNDQHETLVEHSHEHASITTVDAAEPQADSHDCQHCCQCHSVASSVLLTSFSSFWLGSKQSTTFIYETENPSQTLSSLYRPPII